MKNAKKKILIGVTVDGKGGVDSYILSFVKVCANKNIQCDVLTTKWSSDYSQKLEPYNARLIQIANLHNKKSIYKVISKLHEENKYYSAYWNISTCLMYPYVEASKKCGIKNILVHSHAHYNSQPNFVKTIIFDLAHYFYRAKMKKLNVKYAACAKECARWIAGDDIIKNNEWTFIPNPIDIEKCTFNQDMRDKKRGELKLENKFIVGCATAFMPYKNPLFLIDVFTEILKIKPDAYLLLAGTGPMKNEVTNKASELLDKSTYSLLGHRTDVPDLLQAMDAYVLPSKNEGLPLCMLEAQCADLPCLTSKNITDEVIVLQDKFKKCTFESGAKTWAETIIDLSKSQNTRNIKAAEKVDNAGFNLQSPANALKLLGL